MHRVSRIFFRSVSSGLLLLLPCFMLIRSAPAYADPASSVQVTEEDGLFTIKATIDLNAPAAYVRAVLTDFVHIYRLNPSIVESEILDAADEKVTRVRTKVIGCVASYCEEFERVEDVRETMSGDIRAEVVPEMSQFDRGITNWKIRAMGDRSRLTYHAEVEPGFFIPPIVGTYLVKSAIAREIATSFSRLEKIAMIQLERDWDNNRNFSDWVLADNTIPCDTSYLIKR